MTVSSRTGAVARIHSLLALAMSGNENEARNAAMIAARLIVAEGIVLTAPSELATTGEPSTSSVLAPTVIASKYTGVCRSCGAGYGVGERVQWARGKGAAHLACPWGLS